MDRDAFPDNREQSLSRSGREHQAVPDLEEHRQEEPEQLALNPVLRSSRRWASNPTVDRVLARTPLSSGSLQEGHTGAALRRDVTRQSCEIRSAAPIAELIRPVSPVIIQPVRFHPSTIPYSTSEAQTDTHCEHGARPSNTIATQSFEEAVATIRYSAPVLADFDAIPLARRHENLGSIATDVISVTSPRKGERTWSLPADSSPESPANSLVTPPSLKDTSAFAESAQASPSEPRAPRTSPSSAYNNALHRAVPLGVVVQRETTDTPVSSSDSIPQVETSEAPNRALSAHGDPYLNRVQYSSTPGTTFRHQGLHRIPVSANQSPRPENRGSPATSSNDLAWGLDSNSLSTVGPRHTDTNPFDDIRDKYIQEDSVTRAANQASLSSPDSVLNPPIPKDAPYSTRSCSVGRTTAHLSGVDFGTSPSTNRRAASGSTSPLIKDRFSLGEDPRGAAGVARSSTVGSSISMRLDISSSSSSNPETPYIWSRFEDLPCLTKIGFILAGLVGMARLALGAYTTYDAYAYSVREEGLTQVSVCRRYFILSVIHIVFLISRIPFYVYGYLNNIKVWISGEIVRVRGARPDGKRVGTVSRRAAEVAWLNDASLASGMAVAIISIDNVLWNSASPPSDTCLFSHWYLVSWVFLEALQTLFYFTLLIGGARWRHERYFQRLADAVGYGRM